MQSPKGTRIVLPSDKVGVFHDNLAKHDRTPSASTGATHAPVKSTPVRVHKVEPGDTLSAIALHYRVRLADLRRWNPGVDILGIGQQIRLEGR